ncbi:MAG: response regulator [Thermoanaerobaculia bacterium]
MYNVQCQACKQTYDALEAKDCDCLELVRTFRCPKCNVCFCTASSAFKREFWGKAPKELLDRRKKNPSPDGEGNPSVELLTRPAVLFADDDAVSRTIARRVISSAGYGVLTAADGEETLRLAREYLPEVIVADAFMPHVDGREVARIAKKEVPAVRVIVISGLYKDPRYKHEALRDFSVDEYLTKPVRPAALREAIARQLAR